jgi:hypothetical protein
LLEIDGASVANNPFHGKYVEDGAMHQVKVSAPGYITKTEAVAFDGPVSLEMKLERAPTPSDVRVPVHTRAAPPIARKATPAPPAPAPPPVEPTPAPAVVAPPPTPAVKAPAPIEVNPNGGAKPHRQIDPNNPYGSSS